MERKVICKRKTLETSIEMELNVDGKGLYDISTGIGFFDHMLTAFVKHGLFDLKITCKGDLNVDGHHTVEDVGIVLGTAFKEAMGDKKSIRRFASNDTPMDEALVKCAMDLSGRPFFLFDAELPFGKVGDFDTQLVEEFFRAFSNAAEITLHIRLQYGKNVHHIVEAMFKSFGRALDDATRKDVRVEGIPSTKGVI